MKQSEIKDGDRLWCLVNGERVEVEVRVYKTSSPSFGRRIVTRFHCTRTDNGRPLPKLRPASALHRTRSGEWPGCFAPQIE